MYEITIYPNTIAPWFSQVYAGLFDLQRDGRAKVKLSTQFFHPELIDSTSLALSVKDVDTGYQFSILIDLNDNCNFARPDAIDWFDVVVKRSFYPPLIEKLPESIRYKIIPYGINYNCGSSEVPILHLYTYHHLLRLRLLGANKTKSKFCLQHQLRFLFFLGKNNLSLNEEDFIGSPSSPTNHKIFFITRLFIRNGELTDYSNKRIELVKALKKEFGKQFHGGIIKNQISERYCPKELLCTKITRREFTKTLKESDIAICTLGVGQSNPWKLGEAMAAARCIVSEPLLFRLPTPLKEDLNIKTFNTVHECLSSCESLIMDTKKIRYMKDNNWYYYQKYIKANNLLESIIVNSFHNNVNRSPYLDVRDIRGTSPCYNEEKAINP
jgi:hypothetical protein